MKRLKLNKGLSFAMKGFSCTKGKSFEVEDNMAEKLLKTGRFEEVSEPMPNEGSESKKLSAEDISGMKKDELIALAEEYGINIEDCKNNNERAERIQGALGLTNFTQMGMEN